MSEPQPQPQSPQLSPELAERLDAICKRICVVGEVDDEVRRELRAHLEDKAIGYLSGDERLSDADVSLLVERHFGDTKQLRGMLGASHPIAITSDTDGTLLRRLAAALVATVAATFAWQVYVWLAGALIALVTPASTTERATRMLLASYWGTAVGLISFGALLLVWRRQQHRASRGDGEMPWFDRLTIKGVGLVLLGALLVRWIAPVIMASWEGPIDQRALTKWLPVAQGMMLLSSVLKLLLWLWWCDVRPPTMRKTIVGAAVAVFCLVAAPSLTSASWSIVFDAARADATTVHFHFGPADLPIWFAALRTQASAWIAASVAAYFLLIRPAVGWVLRLHKA